MRADRKAISALKKGRIVRLDVIEGRPGGPNNDALHITLADGRVVRVDAYAMSGMTVTLRESGE